MVGARPQQEHRLSIEEFQLLTHELEVHQAELEIQNQELQEARNELEETRDKYFDLYDLAPVGYLTLSEQGLIEEINLAGAAMLGVERGYLLKSGLSRFVDGDHVGRFYRHREKALASGVTESSTLRLIKRDGSARWVQLESLAEAGGGLNPGRIRTTMTDVTALKESEEKVRSSLMEKETLIREIHHRVKNNLQVTSSLLNLQIMLAQEPAVKAALTDSQSRIMAMALIHEMLYRSKTLAAIDLGSYLNDLAGGVRSALGGRNSFLEFLIQAKGVELGIDEAVPCGLIINELLTNSLKHGFRGGGSGKITITARRLSQGRKELVYEDSGPGLPEEVSWDQAKSLGLSLVRGLAQRQLKGSLELDPGKRSRFVLVFGGSGEARPEPVAREAKVLVVEDELLVALDLAGQVQALGYSAARAGTGEEALAVAERDRPQLVLMDISLPGRVNGIEAAQEIRDRWGIPIIFLSALGDQEVRSRAERANPEAILGKPYDYDQLREAIERALEGRGGRGG